MGKEQQNGQEKRIVYPPVAADGKVHITQAVITTFDSRGKSHTVIETADGSRYIIPVGTEIVFRKNVKICKMNI